MNITEEIINKYNKMLLEVMEFYKIKDIYHVNTIQLENDQILSIDISTIGYNGKRDFRNFRDFDIETYYLIDNQYELLVPFYEFSSFFDKTLSRNDLIKKHIFYEMNNSVRAVRRIKRASLKH